MCLETVETVGPFRVRAAEPIVDGEEALEPQARWAPLAVAAPGDQAGPFQDLQMLGDGRLRQRGPPGELDHPGVAGAQALQNCPSRRIGQGGERSVQGVIRWHYPQVI